VIRSGERQTVSLVKFDINLLEMAATDLMKFPQTREAREPGAGHSTQRIMGQRYRWWIRKATRPKMTMGPKGIAG
jgi:hypothetical protein